MTNDIFYIKAELDNTPAQFFGGGNQQLEYID